MATTTPNFGWSVPTSSDLVKNGATAIETLGDSIDASLVDLKGGTTGQVLTKASNTDMDFSWVADATGIPATIFDAKGDIIAASAADTAARLAVGANNTVLTADSSTATGLKWAAPASSGAVTLVTSGTFTSVTSFSVNSVFTSTYKNYAMFVNLSADTTQSTVLFRYRLSGTDNTSNNYYGGQFGYSAAGTLVSNFANPSTSVPLKNVHSIGAGWGSTGIEFTFFDPSNTTANNSHPFTADSFDPGSLNNRWLGGGQLFVSSAAYDGFSFLFSNACTGLYRIYGWG